MDALKKAEEEKKQAAKRLKEVEADSLDSTSEQEVIKQEVNDDVVEADNSVPELFTETSQFSLEPLSLEDKEESEPVIEEKHDETLQIDNVLEETSSLSLSDDFSSEDMTMENSIVEDLNSEEKFEVTQKNIDLNDTTIIEGLSTENESAPFDDTFHGVVFEEDAESDIYEETLPGVPADTLARDLGGGDFQPTPVAAKTVFTTGKKPKKKSSFKWGVFAVLALLALGSFAIFYYFTITPVSRELPSPMVARGIEFSGVETPISIPPVIEQRDNQSAIDAVTEEGVLNTTEQALVNKKIVEQTFNNEKTEKQALIAEFDKQAIETESEINLVNEVDDEVTEIAEVDSVEVAQEPEAVIEDKVSEPALADVQEKSVELEEETGITEAERMQAKASLINISKTEKRVKENALLNEAYKAYQAGQYDAANSLYKGVLKNEPDNRDAHLGLAAVAINNDNRKDAYVHYSYLLELNPLDTLAMSSLIALSSSPDPVKDESAIKLLIQRDDKIHHLHFLLGNIYAKQQRWADAQQAFFDAYRLDSENADYILNLAISLDQLGQYKTALDYYKSALALSSNSVSGFDPVPVTNRISSLSKIMDSK